MCTSGGSSIGASTPACACAASTADMGIPVLLLAFNRPTGTRSGMPLADSLHRRSRFRRGHSR